MDIFDRTTELCSMNEEEIAALAQKIINEADGYISVDDFMTRILNEEHNFNNPKEYKSWCEELGLKEIETFKEES